MLTLLNGIVAIIIGPVVLPAATIAGKKEELCTAMHGKYDPKGTDQCPGGSWLALVPLIRDAQAAPKK